MGLKKRSVFGVLALAVGVLLPSPALAVAAPVPVASGFDSPRGVAFFHGKLVVGEAGTGGPRCIPASESNPLTCFGRTSRISWVNTTTGTHTPLVDHLFSVAEFHAPNQPPDTLGVGGLSARGGTLMAIMGVFPQAFENYPCAANDSACQADVAAARQQAGALLSVKGNGSWRKVAGVGAYDYDYTATIPGQEHDANPNGVLAANGGTYVADAGSNTLDFVSNGGRITVLHYFPGRYPNFPSDEVPTCIARAGDSLWVATLAGNLFRVHGRSATQVANPMLAHVTGCTSDGENVYFVNMWSTPGFPNPFSGNIVQFNAETHTSSVIAAGLNFPNMDTVGPDGNLYFSADSVCPHDGIANFCPNGGTVWKLALAHDGDEHGDGGDGGDNNQNN
ncbi:MAG: ScyD/ScyE family protein [Candidatus Dormibacteraeota bacterium]|nr:ScyD/ScyE family protein [Candidatus Dormibacteraeota bacterium]